MNKHVVLVAEDNPIDALLIDRVIQRAAPALHMVHVENGETMVDYLQGAGLYADRAKYPLPELVLLDLKMPRKDGFAVLKWRQETPAFGRLPIIVFSSSNLPADIARAYALGANSYVIKPTAPEKLEAMVRALYEWWIEFNVTTTTLSPT